MIRLYRGDLAEAAVEAILRPCSSDAAPVSGVSRRLEARAGEAVVQRLLDQGELPVGTAVLTPGGGLPSDFLVHVVVQSREEPMTLAGVQRGLVNALRRATDFGIDSVALPFLGIGAGTLEAEAAASVLAEVIRNHMSEGAPPLRFSLVVESEYEESVLRAALVGVDLSPDAETG